MTDRASMPLNTLALPSKLPPSSFFRILFILSLNLVPGLTTPTATSLDIGGDSSTSQSDRNGFVGCLFADHLCNSEEICFDDLVFGRCVALVDGNFVNDDAEEDLFRFERLPPEASDFLELELKKLKEDGFTWSDEYAQCIIQTALNAIKFESEFDSTLCRELIFGPLTSSQLEEQLQNRLEKRISDAEDDEPDNEVQEETIPVEKSFKVWADNPSDPHAVAYKSTAVTNNEEEDPNFFAASEETGSLIIKPEGLEPETIELEPILDPSEQEELKPIIDQISLDSQQPINNLLDNLEVSSDDLQPLDDLQDDAIVDVETRALETPEILMGLDEGSNLQRHKFGQVKRSQSSSEEQEDDEEDDDSSKQDSDGSPEIYFLPADLGNDDRLIFSRNERFDVKKPGPFFPNSANNFFLNKIIAEEEGIQGNIGPKDPFGPQEPKDSKKEEDKGQIEVEQPLLAPVKDKRLLPVVETAVEDKNEAEDFVHIGLGNRLHTWLQGSDLISELAQELNVPEKALTNRLIEDQHVQFRVEPNPQNIDAKTMAQILGSNINIQKRMQDDLGVHINKVVAGHQHDFEKVLKGTADPGLVIGITLAVVAFVTLGFSALGIALIKRRRKQQRMKQNEIEQEEEDSRLRDQYSQLCRDWSTTTKPTSIVEAETESKSSNGNETKTSGKKISSRNSSKEMEESNRSSTSSCDYRPDEPTTTNMDISTGHMVLAYMEDHLKNKQRLEQEWVALCGYEAEPCATTVAFKAENKKKNRYPDKLPYDHNRVILNALLNKNNSDYINASTVTDHDPRNPPYIVTQGPLSQTVADFWQMVWEQGSVVIVMLSRLQDNGYHLCHRYWPEEGSEKYHIFEVHLVSEHVWCEDYLVRSVYLKNTRTGETRTVTQFHFRSWPAQGVPTSTKALLEFRRKVNKSYRGRSCPIIVHCSDGVGRSGTYILIDMVLNRMAKGCKEIDIAATLEHIRDQRGGMVQTRQQFEFCLMAVAEEVHAILKALPQ